MVQVGFLIPVSHGLSLLLVLLLLGGSRDGTVARTLTSHQCSPGSIPGLGVTCGLSLLLVLILALRDFSPGTSVFKNQHF